MNQPIHNAYWLSRFESILNSALVQHRAVSLIRVDLRFPEYMPVTIMDPDPDSAVISRFFASLKAKIQAYQRHKRRANKRVRATTLRYFWCREFGKEKGTVAKLAMRQPFVLFKGLTFQKLCLP
ncbi:inovirus Gp2 family protein, partial [Escherichia coli]|nr:inovirus Gp2 family protein [Escherichia coli]